MSIWLLFFMPDSAAGQGLKSSLRTKYIQLCLQETVLLFLCPLEHEIGTLHSNHSLSWYGSLESSVFLQERLQCRPRPCLQPLQPCLGTPRHAPAAFHPSVLSRSEPSHSRVTRHPCLAAKLNLPELQPWWVQFGSDQIEMGFCLASKSSAIFENDVFLFLRAANCKKPASF